METRTLESKALFTSSVSGMSARLCPSPGRTTPRTTRTEIRGQTKTLSSVCAAARTSTSQAKTVTTALNTSGDSVIPLTS